ncbi:MAG: periplasmic divalent cation tolerance protein [Bradymonadia bacterium]|jgi:periplasmic divalent cation tolerance protein
MSLQLIYVTAPTAAVADELARGVVLLGLAACANVLPGVRSTYMWEGELTVEEECILLVKTTIAASSAAASWLQENHPYETPCVLEFPVDSANLGFLTWVEEHVGDAAKGELRR